MDVSCPYCDCSQKIDHDDGYGYDEDEIYTQQCSDCDKTFSFLTSITYSYEARKCDCQNGSPHKWEPTTTFPVHFTKMICKMCGWGRRCTVEEMSKIILNKSNAT